MEALLPSEIARLVLGYLQDQKCDEAARAFLKMSPHLQECRTVYSSGRRFSTRVNGLTLIDIFEKFSAANAIVQEKLRKVTDCEQLKHCGDLLEQLRFLVEESRGQRFVVNIKVPSQTNSQISGGSAIISSSIRKRHHSGSDRERYKRSAKSSQVSEEQNEASTSPHCATVEATPLESLPGNSDFVNEKEKSLNFSQLIHNDFFDSTKGSLADCISSLPLETNALQAQAHGECSSLPNRSNENSGEPNEYHEPDKDIAGEKEGFKGKEDSRVLGKCMATDTEELTTYISAEVQTNPYDLPESETESNDELVENLSLLSKELLNRTELHERIADNINKAILPTELSFKDESLCESVGELVNTSIMLELNNAIKSIVEATETDPIFERFFDEIVGPSGETDTSPDEEADGQVTSASSAMAQQNRIDVAIDESSLPEPSTSVTSKISNEIEHPEVPLKQRLRSSSVQQAARTEDDGEKQKERDKDYNALEHQNAAAILSIINANSISDKPSVDSKVETIAGVNAENESDFVQKFAVSEPGQCEPLQSLKPLVAPSDAEVANVADSSSGADRKASKRHPVRKPKATRAKAATEKPAVSNADANKLISEQEMMAIPTLIVCSKEEVTGYLGANPICNENTHSVVSASTSHFIPIAPKDTLSNIPHAMYLKTVSVQQTLPKLTEPPTIKAAEPLTIKAAEPPTIKALGLPMIETAELPTIKAKEPKRSPNCKTSYSPRRGNRKGSRKSNNVPVSNQLAHITESSATAPLQTVQDNSRSAVESITLYGGENSAGTTVETADIPAISVEASLNLCGSSLSPFLKFNRDKAKEAGAEEPREEPPGRLDSIENAELRPATSSGDTAGEVSTTVRNNCDLISKRTPKSLLKSRSKNYRLSLSTPRRRNSHVRTLDFGTPMKAGSSGRRRSGNDGAKFSPKSSSRSKSVCRNTLFKSPPFGNSMLAKARKSKSPTKVSKTCRIPIATRSPAPKLMGGWEKYTGVGMILGGTSPYHTSKSNSPVKNSHRSPPKSSQIPLLTSWDANLRKTRQYDWENESASTQNGNAEKTKAAGEKRNTAPGERLANEAASTSKEPVNASDRENEINADKRQDSGVQEHSAKSSVTEPVVQDARSQLILALEGGGCTSDVAVEMKKIDENNVEKGEADTRIATNDKSKAGQIVQTTTDGIAKVVDKTDAVTIRKGVRAKNAEVKPKKYVKLKTITTNISKREKEDSTGLISTSSANAQSSEILRISPESMREIARMPDTMELETPRKTEDSFGIPPTPRLLSPSSNIVTPFVKASEEDSSKLRSYIRTPEFPPTPNIALTPKHVNENTSDAAKKGEYNACPSYYQPSLKKSEALSELQHCQNNQEDNNAQEISKEIITETYTASAGMKASDDFSLIESRDKLEITQFEVIKENLPREEAARELKISANSKDSLDHVKTRVESTTNEAPATHETFQCTATIVSENLNEQPEASHSDSSSASGNNSSESDSSSSSGSSSSSSSSSSCCSSMTNTSTPFSFGKMGKAALSKIYTDTSNESSQKVVGIEASAAMLIDISPIAKDELPRKVVTIEAAANVAGASESNANVVAQMQVRVQKNEASPEKLIPAVKAEDCANASNETPAKDEALLAEANISETPSSSKAGIENQTNLHSKITALMGSDDKVTSEQSLLQDQMNAAESTSRVLPKIVNVQRILPDVSIALKPVTVSETVSSSAQSSSHLSLQAAAVPDGKLSLQLEEKRLRLMAKLKCNSRVDRVPNKPRGRPSALQEKKQNKKLENTGTVDDRHEIGSGKDSMNPHKERPSRNAIRRSEEKECRTTNTTRAAKGGESIREKYERTTGKKIEVKKKLPSKQDKAKTETTHNEKATSEKNTAATKIGSNSDDDDEATEIGGQAKSEREIHKSDREAHENDDSKKSKHSGENVKNEVKDSKEVKRRESRRRRSRSREPEKCAKDKAERDTLPESSTERNLLGTLNDLNEKVSRHNEHAEMTAAAEKSKCALKSKVDQVKRDLFSDDENNEQRTTRSRTRQISDAQKSDCVNCQEPAACETISEKDSDVPEEDLPCVLESLKLVPTAKTDSFEDDGLQSANVSISKKLEYYFVYDEESAPTKRRKRRYSNSELEYSVTVELSDQDYAMYTKVMRATAYEEMLNISPKPKKRGAPKKTVIKSSQNSKAGVKKLKDGKPSTLRSNQGKPAVETKAATSKTGKMPAKASKKPSEKTSEAKTKLVSSGTEEEVKEKSNTKVRKRKRSASQENEQIEKKSRLIDPQALLNKLDLEQFLTTLHGPT